MHHVVKAGSINPASIFTNEKFIFESNAIQFKINQIQLESVTKPVEHQHMKQNITFYKPELW